MLNFISLAWAICKQDWQERFAGSMLGALWIFIWPLVQLAMYLLIFGKLMGARLGASHVSGTWAYGLYIASGLICWTCFANALTRGARSFTDKRGIIVKVKVNLAIFPAAACLGELIPFAAGLCLLIPLAFLTGWRPDIIWLSLAILAICLILMLSFGLGLLFACFAAFARDINEAVPLALQLAFWFTPIVYTMSILPGWLAGLLWINPMTGITGIFQQCFTLGGDPHWGAIVWSAVASLGSLALGLSAWRHFNKDIRDAL